MKMQEMTQSGSPPILEARNVSRFLGDAVRTRLVEGVNLTIREGEFVAITGPSGGGKSSLLYLLGLLDRPTDGEIVMHGHSTASLDTNALADLRLADIGFVFQFHFLLEEFSALQNVMLPMRQLGHHSESEMEEQAQALLARFDLREHIHKLPDQLSGGQRQRVAIARALANRPKLILADEPTGNLDTKNADSVFDAFRQIVTETRASVVVVTHDMNLAKRADRQIHIVDGQPQ